jgi:hypothetical protein
MKRTYLLIYSDRLGTREDIKEFLDERSEILNWRYDLPQTFYLVSNLSAEELYEIVQSYNQERGLFLISEVGDNTQGWLPKKTWMLLNAEYARH